MQVTQQDKYITKIPLRVEQFQFCLVLCENVIIP